MLSIHVSEANWATSKEYWSHLTRNNLFNKDDSSKIEFLSNHIFSSVGIVDSGDHVANIPSVTTISELMNEIENETKSNLNVNGNASGVANISKNEVEDNPEISMINKQENQTMRRFIQKPV